MSILSSCLFFFFQAEDGIRDADVTGVQTCALPISPSGRSAAWAAGQDPAFTERLRRVGFLVETVTVRAHRPGKGARHCIRSEERRVGKECSSWWLPCN